MIARPLLLASALLAGCAAQPPAQDCSAAGIWLAASRGAGGACEATDDETRSAAFLGQRYAEFSARLDALEQKGEAGELSGLERLERVELIREMEQIVGVAAVRGWEASQPRSLDQGVQKQ